MRVVSIMLIILLSSLPLLLSSYFSVFSKGFYSSKFSKYDVYEKFNGIDMDEYNKEVLDYISGKKDSMPSSIELNEREIQHMEDVRQIFILFLLVFKLVLSLFLIFLLLLFHYDKDSLKSLRSISFRAGIVSLSFAVLLLLFFYLDFDFSFNLFHKFFFDSGSWLFYSTDNIINIYPSGLFFDMFTNVFVISLAISLVLISTKYLKKK